MELSFLQQLNKAVNKHFMPFTSQFECKSTLFQIKSKYLPLNLSYCPISFTGTPITGKITTLLSGESSVKLNISFPGLVPDPGNYLAA